MCDSSVIETSENGEWGGGGVGGRVEGKIFERKLYEAKLEFPKGVGVGLKTKTPSILSNL